MSTQPASPSAAAVRDTCAELISTGKPVTFTAVAGRTGISRTTLYRRTTCASSSNSTAAPPRTRWPPPIWQPRSTSSGTHYKPSPQLSDATKNNYGR